jgi:Ferritin-like domain
MTDVVVMDTEGAETGWSRGRWLARVFAAGGAAAAGGLVLGGLPRSASSAASPEQDVRILNFALLVEYLQAKFYAEATAAGKLRGELREYARIVGAQEASHVAFIRSALGPNARPEPRFNFGDAVRDPQEFTDAAVELEDLVVAAYNGQAPNLTASALAAAARIVSVEARHAAWIRDLAGLHPAPGATDKPRGAKSVRTALAETGFLTS